MPLVPVQLCLLPNNQAHAVTRLLYSTRARFHSRLGRDYAKDFRSFSTSLQANVETVPPVSPQLLLYPNPSQFTVH